MSVRECMWWGDCKWVVEKIPRNSFERDGCTGRSSGKDFPEVLWKGALFLVKLQWKMQTETSEKKRCCESLGEELEWTFLSCSLWAMPVPQLLVQCFFPSSCLLTQCFPLSGQRSCACLLLSLPMNYISAHKAPCQSVLRTWSMISVYTDNVNWPRWFFSPLMMFDCCFNK